MACLDPELSCAICLELFVDPCTLNCMHSYCHECIVKLIEEDGTANQTSVICPQCRHVEKLGAKGCKAIKRNFTLANIVNKYTGSSSHASDQSQKTDIQICLTCHEEISIPDAKHMHVNHELCDIQSGRKMLSEEISKKMKKLEDNQPDTSKSIKVMEEKIADFKLERKLSSNTGLKLEKSEFHIVIQGCDLLSTADCPLCVLVLWESDAPRSLFDVIFVTLNVYPECTLTYYKVHTNRILCKDLSPETEYAVTVRLHKDRNAVSKPYFFSTVPSIKCINMLMRRECHENLYVDESGRKLYNRKQNVPPSCSNFMRLEGTTSNVYLTAPLTYWEVRCHSSYVKRIQTRKSVALAGICFVKDVDRVESLISNYNSYLVGLGKNSKNRLDVFFSKEGSEIKSTELAWIQGRDVNVHLGFLLDLRKRKFFIIDADGNTLLCQFYVIKAPREDNPYVAVFELTPDADYIEIISGKEILELPSVLFDLM